LVEKPWAKNFQLVNGASPINRREEKKFESLRFGKRGRKRLEPDRPEVTRPVSNDVLEGSILKHKKVLASRFGKIERSGTIVLQEKSEER